MSANPVDVKTSFIGRMVGAASFNLRTYEEVEADTTATGQALAVVLLASLAAGVGWIGVGPGTLVPIGILTLVAVMGWAVWAVLTYLIGTHLFPEPQTRADTGELLRTLGFAQAPGILRALGVVPGSGSLVTALIAVWTLATMVVALRQALDYTSTLRAVAVCVTGWVLALAMVWVVGVYFAPPLS